MKFASSEQSPFYIGAFWGVVGALIALPAGKMSFFWIPALSLVLSFLLVNRTWAKNHPFKTILTIFAIGGALILGTYTMVYFNVEEIDLEGIADLRLPKIGKFLFEAGISGLVAGGVLFLTVAALNRKSPSNYLTQGIFATTAVTILMFLGVYFFFYNEGDFPFVPLILVFGYGFWQGTANYFLSRIVSGW